MPTTENLDGVVGGAAAQDTAPAESAATSGGASVTNTGVRVGLTEDAVLDVHIEGQWVWTFNAGRDARMERGRRITHWPRALRPFLRGTGRVVVKDRFGDRVLFDGEHAFDGSQQRTRIVDDQGRPMIIDKAGDLQVGFGARGKPTVEALLDAIDDVLTRLRDEGGVDAFLAFGALLGAVRDGKFIPHDSDADVGYLSKHTTPAGVAQESYELERIMIRAGWWTWRFSAGDFKVIVPDPEGGRAIDVFAGFVVEDTFYLMPEVAGPFREEMFLPLGTVVLEGREVTAPADPDALLELTYGPSWRVPDPSFKFTTPATTRRRMDGWMRGNNTNRNHWWPFYFGKGRTTVSAEPSPFARWVAGREQDGFAVVDIGSGTGRDALWFAREGHQTLGLDYIPAATEHAGIAADTENLPAKFKTFNLYDIRQVLSMGGELAHRDAPPLLYGRFLLHALTEVGRRNLWRMAGMCLRHGGKFYLEFRTNKDARAEHEFGEHFREYLDPDTVVAEIEAAGGRIDHREEGHGMAVYKNEDPHVCRLVTTWQR